MLNGVWQGPVGQRTFGANIVNRLDHSVACNEAKMLGFIKNTTKVPVCSTDCYNLRMNKVIPGNTPLPKDGLIGHSC